MIRLAVRVIVYALVLALAITISPGIKINPLIPEVVPISSTYIVFSILFGLINAFIRPLVLLFTAKLVLRTVGVFAIVINCALLWLMSWVAGDVFIIESPQLLWLILGGAIFTLVKLRPNSIGGGSSGCHTVGATRSRRIYGLPKSRLSSFAIQKILRLR
jgi:putative membrane protein